MLGLTWRQIGKVVAQQTLPGFTLVRQTVDHRYVTRLVEHFGTLITAHQLTAVHTHRTPVFVWVQLLGEAFVVHQDAGAGTGHHAAAVEIRRTVHLRRGGFTPVTLRQDLDTVRVQLGDGRHQVVHRILARFVDRFGKVFSGLESSWDLESYAS